MQNSNLLTENIKKSLYQYQEKDIQTIIDTIENTPHHYHLLYQLPTGGGKTVIFSEIANKYLQQNPDKKVIVLTHRIELCKQTSKMLDLFNVSNKIINSSIKELPNQEQYNCYVAMVETLKNRIDDDVLEIHNVGLVIIDEAHYNSFSKLFTHFENSYILGVTATPLSSNIHLPMYKNYNQLFVGDTIQNLIDQGYLAKAKTFSYNVGLTSLKVGVNGDYTVKSSDELYTNNTMLNNLLDSYKEHSLHKKTLIFNNGIQTSIYVKALFEKAGFAIKHLDNKTTPEDRKNIILWFKKTPNAIITSVGILTTGFDEPTVETIIINRATKSLTLYFQMIGRGSRKLPHKNNFTIIDLGNNALRFGLWNEPIDWQHIFKSPELYLRNLRNDIDIENDFVYKMPNEIKAKFKKSKDIDFDIQAQFKQSIKNNTKAKIVIEKSIEQHATMCIENSETILEAKQLSKFLFDEIDFRIKQYCNCLQNVTKNYRDWLADEYKTQLNITIGKLFRAKMFAEI